MWMATGPSGIRGCFRSECFGRKTALPLLARTPLVTGNVNSIEGTGFCDSVNTITPWLDILFNS